MTIQITIPNPKTAYNYAKYFHQLNRENKKFRNQLREEKRYEKRIRKSQEKIGTYVPPTCKTIYA
jgi:hypothetical protein